MKLPNRHRFATLTALAVLLAGMTTGCLTLCEALLGIEPEPGKDFVVVVPAGEQATLADALYWLSRITLCLDEIAAEGGGIAPTGVYCRTSRDFRGSEPTATAELVTSASTAPGRYFIPYRYADPTTFITGTVDLTVEENQSGVVAELYITSKTEVPVVNEPVITYGCLSTSPASDPIVEYRWWFNYNGNPSSTPSEVTTICTNSTVYTTPGTKTVRLVVRTQSGSEAEDIQTFTVLGAR
ncbi:MAG TPA: hypothetical protein VEC56_10055 [Candidatus Krumholzibacteria bacterium]|nr:hypothetical protein [Candidatus Krumholzibacteria bacterium]